jgi:hypothetical protein
MLESQITQLVAAIPSTKKGKILGQLEDPKTLYLVEIVNYNFYKESSFGGWRGEFLPDKKGDLGHPIIPIMIGPMSSKELSVTLVQA